ncbi:MAG: Crp/Fnr family transcriptional regulator [Gammaproteobacteria bacterium]|nr:Crp/Fnr family transcriptional regulator [Gammaproteobacteria bacterium]
MLKRDLRQHYLFAVLDDAQWRRLLPSMCVQRLAAGQPLFGQGEPAARFFVVCSGNIKLCLDSMQGLEKIMRLVRGGQSFAESVLFSEPPRYPVHAQAVSASLLAAVERGPYLELLRESFDTCLAVMAQMVCRIHAHWDEIEALSLHGSQSRVARYLLSLMPEASSPTVLLPSPKTQIAAQLGLAPETLSRALRALSDRRLIAVGGNLIEVLNAQGLHHCAHL